MSVLKLEGPEGAQKISLMEKYHVDDWVDKVLNRYDVKQTEEQIQEKAAAAWFWIFGASQSVASAFLSVFAAKELPILTCQHQGQLHRVTGCSRLGDVWLTEDLTQADGYTKRVSVIECSGWKIQQEVENLIDLLTPEELGFVERVYRYPNCKIQDCFHYPSESEIVKLWERPEAMGLIKCTGSYSWTCTEKLRMSPQMVMFVLKNGD